MVCGSETQVSRNQVGILYHERHTQDREDEGYFTYMTSIQTIDGLGKKFQIRVSILRGHPFRGNP